MTTPIKSMDDLLLNISQEIHVKASLDKTYATKYYGDVVMTYNRLPTTSEKANPDLTAYVVGKAVDALFDQVAQQEAEIRANPLARTTEILKKVFGSSH